MVGWEALAERGGRGFRLRRSTGPLAGPAPLTVAALIPPSTDGVYRVVDPAVVAGTVYRYWLVEVRHDGQVAKVAHVDIALLPWMVRHFLPLVVH